MQGLPSTRLIINTFVPSPMYPNASKISVNPATALKPQTRTQLKRAIDACLKLSPKGDCSNGLHAEIGAGKCFQSVREHQTSTANYVFDKINFVSNKFNAPQPIQKKMRAKKSSATTARNFASNLGEHKSNAGVSPKFQLTTTTALLVKRQKAKLPSALEGLKRHRRKVGHWAWW